MQDSCSLLTVNCPIASNLGWFREQSSYDIIKNVEAQFKLHLKQNVMAVVTKMNKSFQDKIDAWQYFHSMEQSFPQLFKAVCRLAVSKRIEFELNVPERFQILSFINYAFNSIEVEFVNKQIRKYLALSIWTCISDRKREKELSKLSQRIQLAWIKLQEQDKKLSPESVEERTFERTFIFRYIRQFLTILPDVIMDSSEEDSGTEDGQDSQKSMEEEDDNETEGGGDERVNELGKSKINIEYALYAQRFIEFMIDVESQLPLRRFFHALLESTYFIEKCLLSKFANCPSIEGYLFKQLVELLRLYYRYEIDLMSGEPLTDIESLRKHEDEILDLQRVMWSKYPLLKKFSIKSVRAIDNPAALYQIITSFKSREAFFKFLKDIGLADTDCFDELDQVNLPPLEEVFINRFRRYESHLKMINTIPLFPNESVIWDTNLVPDEYYNYETPLALPKLNLQFLTMNDYLLRNFMLFKHESTYEIRKDIEDGITKSKCRWTEQGTFATGPKQRMALIIKIFSIIDVGEPLLGEISPSKVRAKVIINMDYVRPEWRREWEQLRRHDTCFLISFRKPDEQDEFNWPEDLFPSKNYVRYIRGCQIEGLLDGEGKLIDENVEEPSFKDNLRSYIVSLDCNQYQADLDHYMGESKSKVYNKFHLMVRRKPEKNNFKGVLETIKNLINSKFVVPEWLKSLLIGFGDPLDAHHSRLIDADKSPVLDLLDTFIDYEHLKQNLKLTKPNYTITNVEEGSHIPEPPFKIMIDDVNSKIDIKPYKLPACGPYETKKSKINNIRFTPAQTEAIISGLQPGLTMVVGPPGTGKTDVAVQILSTLYHTYPNQRTLIVTHSNQALNQIFDKMLELAVEEHHMLRLGHGEEDLKSSKDFSRKGRVEHVLAKQLELLDRVTKLSKSLDLEPGQAFTCQSSEYFDSFHIIPRWNLYEKSILQSDRDIISDIGDKFPFRKFFDDAPQPLFKQTSLDDDIETALSCYRYIRNIFDQLRSFRPFEIFNSAADRSQYLLIREAKLIAMTCTHAGVRRKELTSLNFQYDNILMEETAQILEIETTIPLLLQNPENGVNRLKRWIMIGDHHQLPPIIQNSAFQKFSNMEQSLFARFIRLGVPSIELDAQGRARSSICDLYRWRYKNLNDLTHVKTRVEFQLANPGFTYDYQFIDVAGVGESHPPNDPYFYQNREEAIWMIETYKYMLALGYPPQKVTLLTTYNGQKQLLIELFTSEAKKDQHFEKPSDISTVDKYQGQQNDFVLLSLVRTKHVGHIRDIRRLVVAMSRARLGLYVFGRISLFNSCYELQNSMKLFQARPQQLSIMWPVEYYPTQRNLVPENAIQPGTVKLLRSCEDISKLTEDLKYTKSPKPDSIKSADESTN